MSEPDPTWREGNDLDPGTPVVDVAGDDAAFAAAATASPGVVVRFEPTPSSDFGRALGLGSAAPAATVVTCDLLRIQSGPDATGAPTQVVANAVVLGVAPDALGRHHRRRRVHVEVDGRRLDVDRATTVVIANGQFLRGADLVPRGHPGDGRCEVQAYALAPGDRAEMRRRLTGGNHLPHSGILEARGRSVRVEWLDGPRATEADGRLLGPTATCLIEVLTGAARVLI